MISEFVMLNRNARHSGHMYGMICFFIVILHSNGRQYSYRQRATLVVCESKEKTELTVRKPNIA
jgi:hypothetical protein